MSSTNISEQLGGSAELLEWSVSSLGDHVTVVLDGEMDLANADAFAAALARVIETQPATISVDLADLSFLDSSGIRCLCTAARTALAAGCVMVVRRPNSMVLRVLEICGVDELLLDRTNGDALEGR